MKEFLRRIIVVFAGAIAIFGIAMTFAEDDFWSFIVGFAIAGAVWWVSEGLKE